ncbi:MAG: cytochrome c oxidase subunit 3, partial [Deltaproteobacteria bacterium]|nr:cytochrome c oxidase subunit 3 [Deltaproteobacteria bacterium]
TSMGLPAGRLAMWWLLVSEIVIFGGLLGSYLILRLANPAWGIEAQHMSQMAGTINTLVLLTSSLSAVMAHAAAERKDTKNAVRLLLLTVLGAVAFMVIKLSMEYIPELSAGYTPLRSPYWAFYYLATSLHGAHVVAGAIAMLVILPDVAKGKNLQRVEYVGIYWHFVDAVWIFLFPLFYIASASH